jgi:penicillin-binding protein A
VNRQLRFLAVALVVCYAALFTQLNRIQVFQAGSYNTAPDNDRETLRDFSRDRGKILTAEGVVVAESVPSNDRFELQRVYPLADLFAHVTGYFSLGYGSTAVERVRNDVLAGRTAQQRLDGFGNLFDDTVNTGDVTLTLRADIQAVARQALGDREGSVVALDPRTGAVIALWSWPSFDPNLIATHDFDAATQARELLILDPKKPLLANSYQERYMPGSTFKIITTAAGLATGALTPETFTEPSRSYTPPGTTNPIFNYGGTVCGGLLLEAFYRSCNTTFAEAAVNAGAEAMVATTEAFGFNQEVPFDLPSPAESFYPPVEEFEFDIPRLAQTGFGQNDVASTPLQMALTAAAIANGGVIMEPYVVAESRDRQGTVLERRTPRPWLTATTAEIAAWIRGAMVEVVNKGTARCCLQLAGGVQAAAKTGTAQLNTPPAPPSSHAWITTFAPADAPRVVVAVMVKASDEVTAGTGGTVAGPVAKQVLDAVLATPDPLAPPPPTTVAPPAAPPPGPADSTVPPGSDTTSATGG